MTDRYLQAYADKLDEKFPDATTESKMAELKKLDDMLLRTMGHLVEERGDAPEVAQERIDKWFFNKDKEVQPQGIGVYNPDETFPNIKRLLYDYGEGLEKKEDSALEVKRKKHQREDPETGVITPIPPDMFDEDPKVAELGTVLNLYTETREDAVNDTIYRAAEGDFDKKTLKRAVKAVNAVKWHPFLDSAMGVGEDNGKYSDDQVADLLRGIAFSQIQPRAGEVKEDKVSEFILQDTPGKGIYNRDVKVYSTLTDKEEFKSFKSDAEGNISPSMSLGELGVETLALLDVPRQAVEATGLPQKLHESGILGDMLAPGTPIREYSMDPFFLLAPGMFDAVAGTAAGRVIGKGAKAVSTAAKKTSVGSMLKKRMSDAAEAKLQRPMTSVENKAMRQLYRQAKDSADYLDSPSARGAMETAGIDIKSLGSDVGLAKHLNELKDLAEETLNIEKSNPAYGAMKALEEARKKAARILEKYDLRDLELNLENAVEMVKGKPLKRGGLARWWNDLAPAEREALLMWDNYSTFDDLADAQRQGIRGRPYKSQTRSVQNALNRIWKKLKDGEEPSLPQKPSDVAYGTPRKASTVLARQGLKKTDTELDASVPPPGIDFDAINAKTLTKELGPTRPMDRPRLVDFIEDITGERKLLEDLTAKEGKALAIRLKEAELGQKMSDIPDVSPLDDFIYDLLDETREVYLGRTIFDSFRDSGRMVATKLGPEGKSLYRQVNRVNNFFQRAVDRVSKKTNEVLKGIRHGTLEDQYIFQHLDGDPRAVELGKTFHPERLIELDLKAAEIRELFDQVIEQANSSRAVLRDTYGISAKQLPDIPRNPKYVTHLMRDPALIPIHKGGLVDGMTTEVFNQFFKERKVNAPHKESIIDVVNAYFPTALRSVYWDPVRARWKHSLRNKIPTGGRMGKKVGDMVKYADDWVDYFSGHSSTVGRATDALVENAVTKVGSALPGVSRDTAMRAALKTSKVAKKSAGLLSSMVYFNTLGGNITAALSNATQAMNALLHYGPVDFLPAVVLHATNSKLVEGIMRGLKIEGRGLFFNPKRYSQFHKARGTVKGGLFQYLGKPESRAGKAAMSVALAPFQWMEEMVRKITATTSVINGVRKGLPKKEIVERIHRDLAYMQFDFTPVGQLPFLRSAMGRGMFQYATYPIKQLDFYLSELTKAGGGTIKAGMSREVLGAMEPATRWGVYAASVYGVSALATTVGVDLSRAFPAAITEMGRGIVSALGLGEGDEVPKGQDLMSFLPNMGPIPSVTTELFGGKHLPSGQLTGLPKPLEGILVPRPIRTLAQAESARDAGSVRDSMGRFVKQFEEGADLTSVWNAFWSSPTYRSLALGFPQADVSVRYQNVGEALEASQEYKDKRTDHVNKIATSLIRGEFDQAVNLIEKAFVDTWEGPEGKNPLWGVKGDKGKKGINSRVDLFNAITSRFEASKLTPEDRAMKALPSAVRQAYKRILMKGKARAYGKKER